MEQEETFFSTTKKRAEEYLQERLLLFKLQLLEKTARIVGGILSVMVLAFIGFFICLFLSIMAGFFFTTITGSPFYGFGIVAAIYIILFLIAFKYKKKITHVFITKALMEIFFDTNENEEDGEA